VLWHCWLGVRKSIRSVKIEWWGVGVVICLERGADCLYMGPPDATASKNPVISCLIQIQTGFTFLVPAYPVCHLNGCTSSSSSSSSYFQVILTLQLIHSYRVCQNLWLLASSKHVNEFAWLWQTSALVCELFVAPFWTKVSSGLLFTPPFSTTLNISHGRSRICRQKWTINNKK